MKKHSKILSLVTALLFVAAFGFTQDVLSEKVTVPFSNPGKPGKVEVSNQRGNVTIKGYNGQEVIVTAKIRESKVGEENEMRRTLRSEIERQLSERGREIEDREQRTAGLKKLSLPGSMGLSIEEENNTMEIRTSMMRQAVDLEIQVPYSTSLELSSMMGGGISVDNVKGEIDVNGSNGSIKLTSISGTVLAHTLNGNIEVVFKEVDSNKPMSFSAMSGDIDVTLPASTKATLKMKTDLGDIYSDFEIKIDPIPQKVSSEPERDSGRYRISFEKYNLGTINGGGPEYLLKTFQGDILIRKGK